MWKCKIKCHAKEGFKVHRISTYHDEVVYVFDPDEKELDPGAKDREYHDFPGECVSTDDPICGFCNGPVEWED